MVCSFSLKNTSHPEYMFGTESGVREKQALIRVAEEHQGGAEVL